MAAALLDRVCAARRELAIALRQANDPNFDPRTLDVAQIRRLQAAVAEVARASAEASADERDRARADSAYRAYLDDLAQLGEVLDAWNDCLLAHRDRLDHDAERVNAASRWAEAYRQTR